MTIVQQKRVARYLRDHWADCQMKAPLIEGRAKFIEGYMEVIVDAVAMALEDRPSVAPIYRKGEKE